MNDTNTTFLDNFSDEETVTTNILNPRSNDVFYEASLGAKIYIMAVLGLVIFVGVVGNILVLLLIGLEKSMRTTVNRGLFLLAIADLLVLVCLPILPVGAEFLEDDSYLGEAMCYVLGVYDRGALVCSALIFIFLSFDRYFAICHPLRNRELWSGRTTNVILVIIWFTAIGVSMPYIYMNDYREVQEGNTTLYYCFFDDTESWKRIYDTVMPGTIFFLPIPLLVFLYGRMIYVLRKTLPGETTVEAASTSVRRGRVQVVTMLISVVSIFFVCEIPFWSLFLLDTFTPHVFSFATSDGELVYSLVWVFRLMMYVNSIANPIVYFTVSTNFRQAFRNVFCERKNSRKADSSRNNQLPTVSSKL